MTEPAFAVRDPARLAALQQYALLDTPAEEAFDRLSQLAARIINVPVALVTLVDEDRQFFKSCVGLPAPWATQRQTPHSHSFCQHVVATSSPLRIVDARVHPLVKNNLAIRDLNVIAYLGMPITTSKGATLGSFCVIDHKPRVWTDEEAEIVRDLTASVIAEIELRSEIKEREAAEVALRRSHSYFQALIEHAFEMILVINTDGTVRYCSPGSMLVLGTPSDALVGTSIFAIIHPEDLETSHKHFAQLLDTPGLTMALELRACHADGRWRMLDISIQNLIDDEAVNGIVINSRDITERKHAEDQLAHDALHDGLTGLPNRTLFYDRLSLALKQYKRYPDQIFALLYLDLDGFKAVNDQFGHPAGDQILIETSRRLYSCVRPADTVARIGGDEFVIILANISDISESRAIVERIRHMIRMPFNIDGKRMTVSISIGMTLSTPQHEQPDDMIREADDAMYKAKRSAKARRALIRGNQS